MKQTLRLTTPIPPSVNHYLAYRVVKTRRRYMAIPYTTKEAKTYQKEFTDYVIEEAKKQGWDIDKVGEKHIFVDAMFYFPRIDMDCNNYFKVMLDAITDAKIVWTDDNIVCERVKGIQYDSANPHIELVIHPVDYIGIFDNSERLEEFENRCKTCSRYARNCYLLNRAITGHIEDGVNQYTCASFKKRKTK